MVTSNQEPVWSRSYLLGRSATYFSIAQRLADFIDSAIGEGRVDECTSTGYFQLLNEVDSGGFKNEMIETGIPSGLQHSEEFTRGICEARNQFIEIAKG